jgi:hypothetical protein
MLPDRPLRKILRKGSLLQKRNMPKKDKRLMPKGKGGLEGRRMHPYNMHEGVWKLSGG